MVSLWDESCLKEVRIKEESPEKAVVYTAATRMLTDQNLDRIAENCCHAVGGGHCDFVFHTARELFGAVYHGQCIRINCDASTASRAGVAANLLLCQICVVGVLIQLRHTGQANALGSLEHISVTCFVQLTDDDLGGVFGDKGQDISG